MTVLDILLAPRFLSIILSIFGLTGILLIYEYKIMKYFFAMRRFTKSKPEGTHNEEDQALIEDVKSQAENNFTGALVDIFINYSLIQGVIACLIAYFKIKRKSIEELKLHLEERKGKLKTYRNMLLLLAILRFLLLTILLLLVWQL